MLRLSKLCRSIEEVLDAMKTYFELITLDSFEKRLNYLKLDGIVGDSTFGSDRFLNQDFYRSVEWQRIRNFVIARDLGCDLAIDGYQIFGKIIVHHMNPIIQNDILQHSKNLVDPDNLICVSLPTHNYIHYGFDMEDPYKYIERKPNDTCPWRS